MTPFFEGPKLVDRHGRDNSSAARRGGGGRARIFNRNVRGPPSSADRFSRHTLHI